MESVPANPAQRIVAPAGPRRRGHAFRHAFRVLLLLAGALAGALFYLETRGFPESVRLLLREKLHAAGIAVEFKRVRFSLRDGLAIDGVRYNLNEGDRIPLLEARRVGLGFDWLAAVQGRWFLRCAEVRDGAFHLDPGEGEAAAAGLPDHVPAVEHLGALLTFEPAGGRVEGSAELAGIHVKFNGFVVGMTPRARAPAESERPGGAGSATNAPPRRPAVDRTAVIAELRRTASARLREVRALFERVGLPEFPEPAEATVEFFLRPADRTLNEAALRVETGALRWRGLPFDQCRLSARLEHQHVRVERFSVRRGAETLGAQLDYDGAARMLDAQLRGGLPAHYWFNLPLPPVAAERLARAGLRTDRPIRIEARTGRVPLAEALEHLSGRVSAEGVEAFDVWIERLDASFRREKAMLYFTDADIVLGRGRMRGEVRGEGAYDTEQRIYRGQLKGAADPQALLPILNPSQALFAGSLLCRAGPPEVDCEFYGQINRIAELRVAGTLGARDVIYNGTQLAAFSTRLSVTNQVMRLDDLVLDRPEGRLTGWMRQDFKDRTITFDLDSRMQPYAAARIIGPFAHRFLQKFRIEGPAHIVAAGMADYGERRRNDVRAEVEAEGLGMRWFAAEQASFHLEMKERRIEVSRLHGQFHGGGFTGHAVFQLADGDETRAHYAVEGRLAGADFKQILHDLTSAPPACEGQLTTDFAVAGFIGVGQGDTATGAGHLEIAGGRMMDIPLLGGLSRILTYLYPGLGFVSQNDFRAPFTIAGGQVHSDAAELLGEVMTIRGKGDYRFDERLKFVVEVKLLRSGPLAEALRFLTLPLTKLFEFELLGTLHAPKWEPRNLPKEMFLIF